MEYHFYHILATSYKPISMTICRIFITTIKVTANSSSDSISIATATKIIVVIII